MSTPDPAITRNILAQMRDGVLTVDLGGRIILMNPAAGTLLGLAADAVVGALFADVFVAEPRFESFSDLILKAIYASETTQSEEIALPGADGAERRLLVSTTYLSDPDGPGGRLRRIGVIAVLADLSERERRRRMKRLLGQYIDPRVVDLLLRRPDAGPAAERCTMTVLFCDMAGFTSLAERLPPAALLELLNLYLALMSQAVGAAGGVTDKYIGDAVMAYWGPPFNPPEEQAEAACRAALAQLGQVDRLRRLAAVHAGSALADGIDIRIGIATGPVLAGDVGPPHARNFTLIGDAVNLAARLEPLNKEFGTRIIVAGATRLQAGGGFAFRPLGRVRLRGRERPEEAYELAGPA